MGKVIQMAEWKNRKAKPDPIGRGRTYPYNPEKDKETVIKEISRMLIESAEANTSIRYLTTVHEREQAAIKSMELIMQASSYANKYGLKVERVPRNPGEATTYTIIG